MCTRSNIYLTVIFIVGLAFSLLLMMNAQVEADQANLLSQGWQLTQGLLLPFGNPTSDGILSPGSLQSILLGLPLLVWSDHHAPIVLIIISHIAAFFLLLPIIKEAFSDKIAIYFSILYWLSPWRLYLSGFIWNPNFLFFIGALHFWSMWKLKDRAQFWPSVFLVASVGLGFELHSSVLILALSSAYMFVTKKIKINWWGAIFGVLISALPLLPFLILWPNNSLEIKNDDIFIGRGLIYMGSLFKGFSYWLRYASLSVPNNVLEFNFSNSIARWFFIVLGGLTALYSIYVNVIFCKIKEKKPWLRSLVFSSFIGLMLACALSPVTIRYWHTIIIFHICLLPFLFFIENEKYRKKGVIFLKVFTVGSVVLTVLMAMGSRHYSCAGDGDNNKNFASHYQMLKDLNIGNECSVSFDDSQGIKPYFLSLPRSSFINLTPKGK